MKRKTGLVLAFAIGMVGMFGCGNAGATRTGNTANSVNAVLEQEMQQEEQAAPKDPSAPVVSTPEPSTELILSDPGSGQQDQSDATEKPEEPVLSTTEGIDVDLTILSSTMVYSEVYNMLYLPEDYIGKTIRISGIFVPYHDDATGNDYYACIVMDATACCSQGLEFVLQDGYEYPEEGDDITIVGRFDTYQEGDALYVTLRDAVREM